jgi:hypothetical protein
MNFLLFIMLILTVTASSCTYSSENIKAGEYYPHKVDNIDQVLAEISERNTTIKTHPSWIYQAKQGFMIKSFDEIHESDYPKYSQFLDESTLYIIVHPAYGVFFNERPRDLVLDNPLDAFLNEKAYTKEKRFLQEQERSLRDFLEITSTRKRLVILVLPGDYKDYSGYLYRDLDDEYARYINSVTNSSESVLYLYSEKPNRGGLSEESQKKLATFIQSVDPKNILIGGGYLGRCVEDFYRGLAKGIGKEKIAIAAEITSIGREDLKDLSLGDFLIEGKLNIAMIKEIINSNNMKGTSLTQFLRNYRNYRVQKRAND